MHDTSNFRENLNALRAARHLSMEGFSRELGIPKSTLQGVLKDGETSLYTASRISNATGIPLSILMEDPISVDEFRTLSSFFVLLDWFAELDPKQQHIAAKAILDILEVLMKP